MKVILGGMEFGRRADKQTSKTMVNAFIGRGHTELDVAYVYAGGTTEKIVGNMGLDTNTVKIATKANPRPKGGLSKENTIAQLEESLKRLKLQSVDLFYLHAPDHRVPIRDTLEAVHELHERGLFREFGLSNYAAWQVTEIYYIMKSNGWILPTVYQGMYNAITRDVERELFPAIRALGIRFHAYNLLAGGILTGKHNFDVEPEKQPTGRFFGITNAKQYRQRYWHDVNFQSVKELQAAITEAYGDSVTLAQASIRWLLHHSKMDASHGDGIIVGASNPKHLEANLDALASKEPLDKAVLDCFNATWQRAKPVTASYFR